MIERFNFYDVYGYLLPGLLLGAFLGLPLWLAGGLNPPKQLATAGLAIVVGYVLGHFLQRFGEAWLPWTWWGIPRKERVPSNAVLDAADARLPEELKLQLAARIKHQFKLDVHVDETGTQHDGVRRAAFFLCRRELLDSGRAEYAEQFQGMYSMMHGYFCAFAFAAAYYSGLSAGAGFGFPPYVERWLATTLLLWALVSWPTEKPWRIWADRLAGLLVFFLVGAELGWYLGIKTHLVGAAIAGALGCLMLAFKSAQAYASYTETFALTVYRDFLVPAPGKSEDKPKS